MFTLCIALFLTPTADTAYFKACAPNATLRDEYALIARIATRCESVETTSDRSGTVRTVECTVEQPTKRYTRDLPGHVNGAF
jgi:hypothetical protein